MTWLTTNAFPRYWYNYPENPNDLPPAWGITDTGMFGGSSHAIGTATAGYSNRAARLLTNKFTVPAQGATVTFKLYVPEPPNATTYTFSLLNAVTGATLSVSGITAGTGWKDGSVTLAAGQYCLEFRVAQNAYNDVFPKYVLDEVVSLVDGAPANLIETGGDGFRFPPGHQLPYGWTNTGQTDFTPEHESSTWMRPTSYPGVLRVTTFDPTASWFAELLSHNFTVPAGGVTVSCKATRASNAWQWAKDSIAEMVLCEADGTPTATVSSATLVSAETHYTLSMSVPEGSHRIRFRVRTPTTSIGAGDRMLLVNLTEVTPDLVAQGGDPVPPYTLVGWLATQALPRNWINWPINPGFDYPAGDPQPQWGFSGTGPYAPSVVGGAGVQGTEARLITNRFTVPPGGGSLQFEFYNTAVNVGAGEDVVFRNRGDDAWTPTEYAVSGFDKAVTGWQTVTLTLLAGINCLEIYVKRSSWTAESTLYVLDGVTSALIKDGGDAVAFPPSSAIPPGWANAGVVPWQFSAENGIGSVPGELIVYTGLSGLATSPGDYAELLSHAFTVTGSPLSASCYVHLSYLSTTPNATFSIVLCDEVGNTVQTLHTQSPANFTWTQPTFTIPVGTWSLRFRLDGDFTRQSVAFYLDAVEPDLLMQGGTAVETGVTLLSAMSAATVSDATTYQGIFAALLSSSATGASVFSPGTLVSLTLASAATGGSDWSAQPVFAMLAISRAEGDSPFVTLSELELVLRNLITAQSGMPFPADDVETWVMNTETGGFTRYEGFNFNSYAKIGDSYYGCAEDGIYQLDGDTDNGEPIRAMVSFGKQNFGTSALKRITNAYIGVSGQGRMFLKVLAEGQEYTYAARSYDENLQVQRIDTGKGLRVNWLEFELYNADGEDFELASVEFAAVPLSRRI